MRSILQPRWQLQTPVSVLLTAKSSWLLAMQRLKRLDSTDTSTTSQKTRCPPMHPLMRTLMTRMPDVTTIESETNDADISERLSPSETSTRL
jgi:hypothetical protein